MIALTLVEDDQDIFINPMQIVGIVANDKGGTDIVCVDQTIFCVKETPMCVFRYINEQFN